MTNSTLLQIFLAIDLFGLGVLATIATQHAISHYRGPHKDPKSSPNDPSLPPAVKERLLKDSQAHFQNVLDTATDKLQHDLKSTSDRLNLHLEELGNKVIDKEMGRYREDLDKIQKQADSTVENVTAETAKYKEELKDRLEQLHSQADGAITEVGGELTEYKDDLKDKLDLLHKQAEKTIGDVSSEIIEYKDELKKKLDVEMADQQQELSQQLDQKLADAVVAFLDETLQHNVDLGAQSSYLTEMLEEHKADLIRGVTGEKAKPTK